MIHTVKSFGIVNKAEINVFLELSSFFDDPADVGNLISGSSAFSKTSLNIWKSQFTYCWSLAWRILSITLLMCERSAIEHSLAFSFLGIGMKTDLFQSCDHCWVFQICWHIECSTFTASYLSGLVRSIFLNCIRPKLNSLLSIFMSFILLVLLYRSGDFSREIWYHSLFWERADLAKLKLQLHKTVYMYIVCMYFFQNMQPIYIHNLNKCHRCLTGFSLFF